MSERTRRQYYDQIYRELAAKLLKIDWVEFNQKAKRTESMGRLSHEHELQVVSKLCELIPDMTEQKWESMYSYSYSKLPLLQKALRKQRLIWQSAIPAYLFSDGTIVAGDKSYKLTDPQGDVVEALVEAGKAIDSETLIRLSGHDSAPRILRRLLDNRNAKWLNAYLKCPGVGHSGGYTTTIQYDSPRAVSHPQTSKLTS